MNSYVGKVTNLIRSMNHKSVPLSTPAGNDSYSCEPAFLIYAYPLRDSHSDIAPLATHCVSCLLSFTNGVLAVSFRCTSMIVYPASLSWSYEL